MSYKGKTKSRVFDSIDGYNQYAPYYDASIGYLNSFERDELIILLGELKGKKVLDIGCGTGRMIHHLRNLGATVVATDISEEMLKICKKKYSDVETVLGDMEDLPFEEGSFDVVLASFVVVHLKYLERAFEEAYRVLKDKGQFFVTNINQRKAPKLKIKDDKEIIIESYYHRPEDIKKALENNLFIIEKEKFVGEGKIWINQIVKAVK